MFLHNRFKLWTNETIYKFGNEKQHAVSFLWQIMFGKHTAIMVNPFINQYNKTNIGSAMVAGGMLMFSRMWGLVFYSTTF